MQQVAVGVERRTDHGFASGAVVDDGQRRGVDRCGLGLEPGPFEWVHQGCIGWSAPGITQIPAGLGQRGDGLGDAVGEVQAQMRPGHLGRVAAPTSRWCRRWRRGDGRSW